MKLNKQKILFMYLIIITLFTQLVAQKSKINGFDIAKVHKAIGVELMDSTQRYLDNNLQSNRLAKNSNSNSNSYMIATLKIICCLVLITIIIIFAIWLIKRLGFWKNSRITGGAMDLLETLPIGQNKSILLMRVMENVLVLSQTSQQITLLEKIEGAKAVELIASTKGGTSIVQFKEVFNNFVGKLKKSS